jgi:hypothetical protein
MVGVLRGARLVASSLGVGALLYACLSPTQITARISTDVDCTTVAQNQTAIYGASARTEPPITTTRACDPAGTMHDVGTLVIAPRGDEKDQHFSVVVVAGVDRPSEECAANDYKGCIVARRRMSFVPHEPLELPIELLKACLDVPCDEDKTCFRGACISANATRINGCLGPDCDPTGGSGDGGTDDATLDSPATADAPNDARVVPETSVAGWQTVVDTSGLKVRGLAENGGVLWWTQDPDGPAFRSFVCNTAIATPAPCTAPVNTLSTWLAYGIVANANGYAIAGDLSGNCLASGGSLAVDGNCNGDVGFGIAADVGSQTFWVTAASDTYRFVDSLPVGPLGFPGWYAEGNATGFWFASGTSIIGGDWTTGAVLTNLAGVLPLPGHGFAMSSTHWFASTTDGTIFAVAKATNIVTKMITTGGLFTDVEDILYVEPASMLYIAATRGATTGIFSLHVATTGG